MQKIPPVTRNLLLLNIVCFLIQKVFEMRGVDLTDTLGLHFLLADSFNPLQFVTYMFLHGNLTHLFFNMFSLWMFGRIIEQTMGLRRFLTYYFVTGIGAGICQELWQGIQYAAEGMAQYEMVNTGSGLIPMGQFLNYWTTIGASGACYGILLAFGMLYPNERLMLLFPPIPMKAKYFVAGYAAIEIFSTWSANDNVAHFAHLGGMLFGFFLLRYWKRRAERPRTYSGWTEWPEADSGAGSARPSWKEKLHIVRGGKSRAAASPGERTRRESDYEYNIRTKEEEARMDEILDKVRKSGYDSLTAEERKELFRLSRK